MTPHRPSYQPASTFVVRVAGMPMEALLRLRFDRTMRLVREILEIQRWLERHGEPLADKLHGAIGGVDDTELRRRLIALRRDVYAARLPKEGTLDGKLVGWLPGALADEITEWCERVRRRVDLQDQARPELEAELAEKRLALRDAAADTGFQQGITLVSRDFYPDLTAWVDSGARPDRQLERRIAKYLARMAAKTSPYSTFTSWTQGQWADSGAAVVCSPTSARRSAVELDTAVLRQISGGIAELPEVRGHLPVAVNTSVVVDDAAIRFLDGQDGEGIKELSNTPTLQRFLSQIRHGADRSYDGVVLGLAEQESQDRRGEIAAFLDKLIEIGLVDTGFGIPDDSVDYLGLLAEKLEHYEGNRVQETRSALLRVRSELATYAETQQAAERFEQAAVVHRELVDLYQRLGQDLAGEPFPKSPFHEDTLLAGADFQCRADAWTGVLDDLDLVRRLAGLYDRFLPGRLAAESFFARHYGSGASMPLLEFYREFCKEIRQPAGWREGYAVSGSDLLKCYDEPLPVPELPAQGLAELAELQQLLVDHVAEQAVDETHTRRLDGAVIHDLVAKLPDHVTPIRSMACYCQVMVDSDRPRAVVNELTSGFGRSRAKPLRLDALAQTGIPEFVGEEHPDVPRRYASVAGGTRSNLNLTYPTTASEIGYPGGVSGRAQDSRFPLGDLLVTHDAESGCLRLVSESTGDEVVPVHLGLMVEFLLPPAYRFLIQIFGQAVPRFEFLKQLGTAAPEYEADGVRSFPRLCLGDVTLNRRTWTVGAENVPTPEKGEPSLDYLIRLHRWRAAHGIPEQCFIRVFHTGADSAHEARVSGLRNKARKPMYVDFASYFSVRTFERTIRDSVGMVVLEEMLPGYPDLVVKDAESSYVSEFVFELNDGNGDNE